MSVPDAQSVESLAIVRRKVTLSDYLHLTEVNSQNILPLNLESHYDYDNKTPP